MDTEEKPPATEPDKPASPLIRFGKLIALMVIVYVAFFVWFAIYLKPSALQCRARAGA